MICRKWLRYCIEQFENYLYKNVFLQTWFTSALNDSPTICIGLKSFFKFSKNWSFYCFKKSTSFHIRGRLQKLFKRKIDLMQLIDSFYFTCLNEKLFQFYKYVAIFQRLIQSLIEHLKCSFLRKYFCYVHLRCSNAFDVLNAPLDSLLSRVL